MFLDRVLALTLVLALALGGLASLAGCRKAGGGVVAPPQRTLAVFTSIPGADVLVDGISVGTTPLEGMALGTEARVVTVKFGNLVWEEMIEASPQLPHALYLETGGEQAASFQVVTVGSTPVGATVFLNGTAAGTAPVVVHSAVSGRLVMAAYAEGYLPARTLVWPGSERPWSYSFALAPAKGGLAGPTALPRSFAPPVIAWPSADHAVVRPAGESPALVSPQGLLATVVAASETQSVLVYDLAAGQAGASHGDVLATWRTDAIAREDGSAYYQGVTLVGWSGPRKLLFLAPESKPGGSPARLGTGLWEADADSGDYRRIAWVPTWFHGRRLQQAWLTRDGKAAIIHTWESASRAYFHVVNLASGSVREVETALPFSDPGGCTLFALSPDGWHVAYGPGLVGPANAVRIFDLGNGEERAPFASAIGGSDLIASGRLTWSPDGLLLAVPTGAEGEPYVIVQGDDGAFLFPSEFAVVDADGRKVAEVAIAGHTMGMDLVWSPDSKSVSVRTVQAAPQAPDDFGNVWSLVQGQVFAGILGGELKPVTAGDEDVSGHGDWGFVGQDSLVISGLSDSHETACFRGAGREPLDFPGYAPLRAWRQNVRASDLVRVGDAVLLCPTSSETGADSPLLLVGPDGAAHELPVKGVYVLWASITGNWLAFTGDSLSGEGRQIDVVVMGK